MRNYYTLSALNNLATRGFMNYFNLTKTQIKCKAMYNLFMSNIFKIVEMYRFDYTRSAGHEYVVYDIKANDQRKEILVDAYGVYFN